MYLSVYVCMYVCGGSMCAMLHGGRVSEDNLQEFRLHRDWIPSPFLLLALGAAEDTSHLLSMSRTRHGD